MAAPATAIVGYDLKFYAHPPKGQEPLSGLRRQAEQAQTVAFRNGSLQGAYLIMAARALGLDCGPMSGFDNAGVDKEFFAGTDIKSNFLCNLGYRRPHGLRPRGPRFAFDEMARSSSAEAMNVLAFDTCFGAVSAAVRWRSGRGEWLLREAYEARSAGHAERLFPMIAEVMEGAGLAFSAIDRIAVTLGPGGFTGVRVGIAAARALALATGKPVVATTSLAVMAHRAEEMLAGRARWSAAGSWSPSMPAAACALRSELHAGAIETGEALLLTPEAAARASGRARCCRRRLGGSRGRRRGAGSRRRRRASLARTCSPMPASLPSWPPASRRSSPSGRSICGRRMPAAGAATPCRGRRHDEAGAARALSIRGWGPQHAGELARLHAPPVRRGLGCGQLRGAADHPGSHARSWPRRAEPLADACGLHPRAAGGGRGRDPHPRACARTGSGWASAGGWSRSLCRAAGKAERAGSHLEVAASNVAALALYKRLGFKESGRRKGYYERPGAPPRTPSTYRLPL